MAVVPPIEMLCPVHVVLVELYRSPATLAVALEIPVADRLSVP